MAAELHRALPQIPIVRGDGNRLPFATASADLITYAQSWHWTDQALAAPEALRVLCPGGALALWWNVSDHSVPWIAEQDARLRRFFGADDSAHGSPVHSRDLLGRARLRTPDGALDPPGAAGHPPRQPRQPLRIPRPR